LSANGGSGTGAYSFAVSSVGTADCSITGGGTTLTATAAGSCDVIATRAADNNYNAAASSATSVTISAAAVNGVCATVAASAFMPVNGLCTTGTASAVSAASPWAWTCTGSGGGTPASCSAPNAATGNGTVRAVLSGGRWVVDEANSGFVPSSTVPSRPPGYNFPYGLLNIKLTSGTPGSVATVVITYPRALLANTVYWKYGRTRSNTTAHWYPFAGAVIAGNTITLTLTDGADGDDDMAENGTIVDPGGPGEPEVITTAIPTLSEWGLIFLSCLLAMFGMVKARRRKYSCKS
jgi:hypothetical protein